MNQGTREVSIGTEVVTTANQTFKEIKDLVDTVSMQVHEISTEIQQTADASNIIVGAVSEINEISRIIAAQTQTVSAATEEQSASIEEIAAASQILSKMAQDLETALMKFTV